MPLLRVRRTVLGVALALCLFSAGCTSAPAPEPAVVQALAWTRLEVPEEVAPSSLAVSGSLLVGGRANNHPVLFVVGDDGSARPVPLRPHSPYAKVADLVSVTGHGREVVALGAAHGGAHANFRWTVWTGTTAGLDDRPQTFETFGGQSAGSLLDAVSTGAGPLVVGSWSGRYGLDAAVWRPMGSRWVRQESTGTPLANQAHLQVAPRSAAASPERVLISGSVITFADGIHQQAALWTAPRAGRPWTLVRLPGAGAQSEALSSACLADSCWVAGRVDGRLALWSLPSDRAARRDELPSVEVDTEGPGPQVVLGSGRPTLLASRAGVTTLLTTDGPQWRQFEAPPGQVAAAASRGERLYAVLAEGGSASVWTTDLPAG